MIERGDNTDPAEMRLIEQRKLLFYGTLNIKTRKIENTPEQEVENECVEENKERYHIFPEGKYE